MVEATTAPAADVAEEPTSKEAIYLVIAEWVLNKTGKKIGKTGGRDLFDRVVEEILAAATRDNTFRFNGGFGSMHVKNYQAGTRRLPSGAETTFGERKKLRYEQGVVTTALIENGGDLVEALKVRGSRAAAPAAEAPPVEKTPKAPKATKPAAAPAEALADDAGGDLELD